MSFVHPALMSNNCRFVSSHAIRSYSSISSLGTLDAQRQSFYIPNYFEAVDALNAEDPQDSPFPAESSSTERPSTAVRSTAPVVEHPLTSSNDSLSTASDRQHFEYREPAPPHEQMNRVTKIRVTPSPTIAQGEANRTESPIEAPRGNKGSAVDENNRPSERAGHQSMQSLIHLLPSNLWSQLQNNRSNAYANQTHLSKPALPDPVLLAEAAAQAGLPGPGPYPIPEHLWPYSPSSLKTKPTTRSRSFLTIISSRAMSFSFDDPKTRSNPTSSNHRTASDVRSCSVGDIESEQPFSLLSNWFHLSSGSEWSSLSRSTIVQYVFHLHILGSA